MTAPIEYNVPITPDTAVKMALSMTTQTLYYVDNNGNVQILASVAANGGNFTNVNITGGTIQGVALTIDSLDSTPVGANTPSTGRFTTLTSTGLASFNSLSTANATITGGSITGVSLTLDSLDNTPIGAATPSTGKFTTLQASGVITSTLATGTAPFSITSTTVVPNLNVSQLLGNTWAVPGTIGSTTPNSGAFTTISTNTVTSVTPVLGFNAANTSYASGSTVANNYLQTVLQNKSGTTGASTNYVLSNDLGTDSSYYGEFGMNSSVFSSGTPSDFFSINNGVYFSGHDGDITFGSGNGYKSYFAWGATGASAHVINTSGAIGLSTNLGTTPALSGTTGFGTAGQVMISNGSGAANTWSSTPTLIGTNFTGIPNGALTNSSITFGGTAAALGSTVSAFNAVSIGATTASTGAFTTLSASSTVSGSGFSTYLASPPAIGGTAAAAGTFTTLTGTTKVVTPQIGSSSGAFTIQSANTTAVTVDASQNVGIGTASPTQKLDVTSTVCFRSDLVGNPSNAGSMGIYGGGNYINGAGIVLFGSSHATSPNIMTFNNASYIECMRIDASGNLLVGANATSAYFDGVLDVYKSNNIPVCVKTDNAGAADISCWSTATSGNNTFLLFGTEASFTGRGSITYNRGAGLVAYNTTSDQRLKENIVDASSALSKIDSVKVRSFDWKESGNHVDFGVIAQELVNVAPECVTEGDDGDEIKSTWQVDTSALVPALVKAIQELNAKVTALEEQLGAK